MTSPARDVEVDALQHVHGVVPVAEDLVHGAHGDHVRGVRRGGRGVGAGAHGVTSLFTSSCTVPAAAIAACLPPGPLPRPAAPVVVPNPRP